jgi:threonine synthase
LLSVLYNSGLKSPTDGDALMEKLKGLKCRECGRSYPSAPVHVCEFCFGPLEVDYRYEALKGVVTRESIAGGPPSMWRYKDLLPIDGAAAVGHHVGFTPLIRARNLADELGCQEIWVKNDSVCHPTWSFKDRVVAVAVTKAKEFGFDTVACASTGNLANSVAAHAAEARLKSYIFIPADLEQGKILATLVYNPTLVAVEGTYDEVNRLCSEIADKYRWAFVNVNFRPYYSEGSKSYGFEIAAQAAGCGPIVTMIKNDTDVLKPVRPQTIAKSLAIGNPADGYYAYRTAKESGGFGEHATDEEIIEGMLLLARTEGIFTETAGGVTVAVTKKLIEQGVISRAEPIVVCITGNGLKTPDSLYNRLETQVTIRPTLSAFDRALANLKAQQAEEAR